MFLKLLAIDQEIMSLAPSFLAAMGNVREVERDELPLWLIPRVVLEVPARRLSELAKYTANEEDKLREGARVLCAALISAITRENLIADIPHTYPLDFKNKVPHKEVPITAIPVGDTVSN